jgi:hypothetical protein
LTSPGTFLASEEPTNDPKARQCFFWVPLDHRIPLFWGPCGASVRVHSSCLPPPWRATPALMGDATRRLALASGLSFSLFAFCPRGTSSCTSRARGL